MKMQGWWSIKNCRLEIALDGEEATLDSLPEFVQQSIIQDVENHIFEGVIEYDEHAANLHCAAAYIDALIKRTSGAHCRYFVMNDEYMSGIRYPELVRDNNGNRLITGEQYMVITCANGYMYYVNISGDSVLTACAETFQFISGKL